MSSETRQALIRAADEVFRHFGFKKASIEDIAKRAGVGKGTVYLHFDSKEALFEAVLRKVLSTSLLELESLVFAATSPESKLSAYIDGRMAQSKDFSRFGVNWSQQQQGDAGLVTTLAEFAGAGKNAINVIIEFRNREITLIKGILDEGRAAGVFHIEDTEAVAKGFVGVAHAGIARMISGQDDERTSLTAIFDLILRGLSAPPNR